MRYIKAFLSGIMLASFFSFVVLILQSFENKITVWAGQTSTIVYNVDFLPIGITFTIFAACCIILLELYFGGKK